MEPYVPPMASPSDWEALRQESFRRRASDRASAEMEFHPSEPAPSAVAVTPKRKAGGKQQTTLLSSLVKLPSTPKSFVPFVSSAKGIAAMTSLLRATSLPASSSSLSASALAASMHHAHAIASAAARSEPAPDAKTRKPDDSWKTHDIKKKDAEYAVSQLETHPEYVVKLKARYTEQRKRETWKERQTRLCEQSGLSNLEAAKQWQTWDSARVVVDARERAFRIRFAAFLKRHYFEPFEFDVNPIFGKTFAPNLSVDERWIGCFHLKLLTPMHPDVHKVEWYDMSRVELWIQPLTLPLSPFAKPVFNAYNPRVPWRYQAYMTDTPDAHNHTARLLRDAHPDVDQLRSYHVRFLRWYRAHPDGYARWFRVYNTRGAWWTYVGDADLCRVSRTCKSLNTRFGRLGHFARPVVELRRLLVIPEADINHLLRIVKLVYCLKPEWISRLSSVCDLIDFIPEQTTYFADPSYSSQTDTDALASSRFQRGCQFVQLYADSRMQGGPMEYVTNKTHFPTLGSVVRSLWYTLSSMSRHLRGYSSVASCVRQLSADELNSVKAFALSVPGCVPGGKALTETKAEHVFWGADNCGLRIQVRDALPGLPSADGRLTLAIHKYLYLSILHNPKRAWRDFACVHLSNGRLTHDNEPLLNEVLGWILNKRMSVAVSDHIPKLKSIRSRC